MSKAELLIFLQIVNDDPYADHVLADMALLKYIDDPEVTAAFNAIRKWYC